MNLRLLPEASVEAVAAAIWYEDQKLHLGEEFLNAVEYAITRVREKPNMHPKLEYYSGKHDIRRCLTDRFPYAVIFQIRPSEILVVAIAHTRKMPLYWLSRLA